eukprot:TRINITY_DN9726_c0_g2_i5.p4 TRINITY_DN9726_c0_g2~~TRINITY_DN9726_c0_g2_i5.p4  ORF type:complete len:193 (+),score=35.85 TRINITY_DN9726_c0_g2_i5:1345-1923(+)
MDSHLYVTITYLDAVTGSYRYFQRDWQSLGQLLDTTCALLTHENDDCRKAAAKAFHRLITGCSEHVFALPNVVQLFTTAVSSLQLHMSLSVVEALVRMLQSRAPEEQYDMLHQVCTHITAKFKATLAAADAEGLEATLEAASLVFRFLPDTLEVSDAMAQFDSSSPFPRRIWDRKPRLRLVLACYGLSLRLS